MHLHPKPFERIKNGTKTVEKRLLDEKRKQIKVGDTIIFESRATGEQLPTTVVAIHKLAPTADLQEYYPIADQQKYGVIGIEIRRK